MIETSSAVKRNSTLPENYYRQYIEAARSHWWFRGRERVLRAVVRPLVGIAPKSVVLDVGSGPVGSVREIFPEGYIVAVDQSSFVLGSHTGGDGRVVGGGARLPCQPKTAAVVCALDILEHLDDDVGALRNWREALVPGGWLVVTVPAYARLWSAHDEINGHRRRYRARALQRLLSAAGYKVVRLTYFNSILLPGIALARWMERFLNGSRGFTSQVEKGELDCQWRLPRWLERCCEGALRVEALWLRRRVLPAGVSICAVAQVQDP